jgi:nucleotide-binding universal stress UspA family protein
MTALATMVCAVGGATGSGSAVPVARALARRLGLRLELLHVVARGGQVDRRAVRRQAGLPADAELRLDAGPVAARLVEAAEEAELLVVGAGRAGRLRRAVSGGVAATVARSCRTPVLVVPLAPPLRPALPPGAILCGVRDREDVGPARIAARFAQRLHASLTLAHVPVLPPPVVAPADPGILMPAVAEKVFADDTARVFAEVEAGLPSPTSNELRLPAGGGGQELARAAIETHAAMIVVGAPRHGALTGALTGSVVWTMLGAAPAPLLVCPRPRP